MRRWVGVVALVTALLYAAPAGAPVPAPGPKVEDGSTGHLGILVSPDGRDADSDRLYAVERRSSTWSHKPGPAGSTPPPATHLPPVAAAAHRQHRRLLTYQQQKIALLPPGVYDPDALPIDATDSRPPTTGGRGASTPGDTPRATARSYPDVIERWRPLVTQHFPAGDVEWAMRVIACESTGNPTATNGSHVGLMQHSLRYWPDRAAAAGRPGANPRNPDDNLAVSAWLLATGGRGHWTCR